MIIASKEVEIMTSDVTTMNITNNGVIFDHRRLDLTILSVFFGFKFLPNKEEKNNFPPEEGGILEEFLPLDLEYISPVQIQL